MTPMLLASLLAVASPAGTTLEQGLKREVTLLIGEEEALRRELERLQTLRTAKVASLQRDLAALEARAVEASTREAAARAALDTLSPSMARSAPSADAAPVMREALRLLGVPAPADAATGDPLVDLLGPAMGRLEARTSQRRVETGFFAADGTWVQGAVLFFGDVGVAAAADVAGPLLPADDGTMQVASSSSTAAADASRQLVGGLPASLWPLAFPGADDVGGPAPRAGTTTFERLLRLGVGGGVVVLLLLLAVGFAVGSVVVAARRHAAVVAVAGRLVGLVTSGETVAAAALARTIGGVAGRFLVAVVAVVGRSTPEDEVAALSAEATSALQRTLLLVRGALAIAAAAAVVVAVLAMDGAVAGAVVGDTLSPGGFVDGLGAALLPLQLLAVAAVPAVIALVAGDVIVARTRELLEVTALRLLDAAPRGD